MSKPRNPRYFPRMKVRGARRRRIAGVQRVTGAFDRLGQKSGIAALGLTSFTNALTRMEQEVEW